MTVFAPRPPRLALAALALAAALPAFAMPEAAVVERISGDAVAVRWRDANPVDVYVADRPDADPAGARLISRADRDGRHEAAVAPSERAYFLLVDRKDGGRARVAERLLPLEHGSNFRDVGGYPAAGGKHVRWGMIYRSGATPLLSEGDRRTVSALHLADMIDLRTAEERQLAPTTIEGVPYHAVGYSVASLMAAMKPAGAAAAGRPAVSNGAALYQAMPDLLAPQFRLLFQRLLAKEGPVAFNCSAGQDRTGLATALILSALGVPRDVIIADYHLSTGYRRPEYEMAKFDPAAFPGNAAAKMLAAQIGAPAKPLKDETGTTLLTYAFEAIERKYGSVEGYLDKALGVGPVDIAALRAAYLE